jgi:hypothetical protein
VRLRLWSWLYEGYPKSVVSISLNLKLDSALMGLLHYNQDRSIREVN